MENWKVVGRQIDTLCSARKEKHKFGRSSYWEWWHHFIVYLKSGVLKQGTEYLTCPWRPYPWMKEMREEVEQLPKKRKVKCPRSIIIIITTNPTFWQRDFRPYFC